MSERRPQGRWLVDGMNVIGSRPDGWWNDPDEAVREMIRELGSFAASTGDKVVVVFDRRPADIEPGRRDDIQIGFASRRGRNAADDDIVEMVVADDDPRSLTVVTSDRHLAQRVRELGAQITGAGMFRKRLDESLS
jgi:predicted RNA-binding protein with PIN domain